MPTRTKKSHGARSSIIARLGFVLVLLAGVLTAAPASSQTAVNTVDLRILLVSADGTEPALEAWRSRLTAEGVPFDLITTVTAPPITPGQLVTAPGHARYQAIVLAGPELTYFDGNAWVSSVAPEELTALHDFEQTYHVRQVDAYAYPTPALGLNEPTSAGNLDGMTATVTPLGSPVFPYLVGQVPIEDAYGYLATPSPAEGTTFDALLTAPTGEPLVGVYNHEGREEMVVTVDSSPWVSQGQLLLHGMLQWVTRGTYLGFSRNYLGMHVDDVFLPDDRWDTVQNVTHEDDGATIPLIRMNDADARFLQDWQQANDLKLDLVFNGGGSNEYRAANGSDPLADALVGNRRSFRWINHTFGHLNLDTVSQSTIESEINRNRLWAWARRISIDPNELVTGEHSGLANEAMPGALRRTGIHLVASDASRTPNQTPLGSALTIPRHPMNVYYNTATKAEQLDEYNYLYFENCASSATTTCLTAPATWEQYLNAESSIMMRHILTNDPRPHYAHQANLAEDRILFSVLDDVLARYRASFKVPLVQPTMTEVGKELARRATWNSAVAAGLVSASIADGVVTLKSSVDLAIPVTTTVNARLGFFSFGQRYGDERSGWFSLRSSRTAKLRTASIF